MTKNLDTTNESLAELLSDPPLTTTITIIAAAMILTFLFFTNLGDILRHYTVTEATDSMYTKTIALSHSDNEIARLKAERALMDGFLSTSEFKSLEKYMGATMK